MAWLRDHVTGGPSRAALAAALERSFQNLDAELLQINTAIFQMQEFWRINGVHVIWIWDDSVVMADPGTGEMRQDTVQWGVATQFALSAVDAFGKPLRSSSNTLENTRMVLADTASGRYFQYDVDTLTDNDTWILLDVTPITGVGNNPLAGDLVEARFSPALDIQIGFAV